MDVCRREVHLRVPAHPHCLAQDDHRRLTFADSTAATMSRAGRPPLCTFVARRIDPRRSDATSCGLLRNPITIRHGQVDEDRPSKRNRNVPRITWIRDFVLPADSLAGQTFDINPTNPATGSVDRLTFTQGTQHRFVRYPSPP